MTTAEIIQTVAVCFTGVTTILALVAFFQKMKVAAERRNKLLLEQMAANITDLKHHSDVQTQKLNGMLTYVIHSFDRPAWLKVARKRGDGEVEFRMMEMNESYAAIRGIPRVDYIGKTDLEAGWDHSTAEVFRSHDLAVWASGEPATFVENIEGRSMRFRKLRIVCTSNNELKGIFGYAVDCNNPDSCPVYAYPDQVVVQPFSARRKPTNPPES